MVQAAAHNVVDFSDAELLDRQWWLRLTILLDQIERDNLVCVRTIEHERDCALLNYQTSKEAFDKHWNGAVTTLTDIWDLLFQWKKVGNTANGINDRLRQAWIAKYGEMDDPETLRRIKYTVDYLRARKAKAHADSNKPRLPRRTIKMPKAKRR